MRVPIPLSWKLALGRAFSPFHPPAGFPGAGPRLIVALAADYGNLGDVALTRSLVEFAALHLPLHLPVLLPAGRIFRDLRGVSRACSEEDVVAIVGGGNMGDLYPDLEEGRRQAVRAFRRQRVISFPQSVDFSDTSQGRAGLVRSRKFYSDHRRLTLFARDTLSCSRMRAAFPDARVELAPDTVLSMGAPMEKSKLGSPLICLRDDKEALMGTDQRDALTRALVGALEGARLVDTVVPGPRLSYESYREILSDFLGEVARAPVVITDRLHGMIFCAITGTACVVIPNNNRKIESLHSDWLSGQRNIRLMRGAGPAEIAATAVAIRGTTVSPPDLGREFTRLAEALRG